MFKKAGLNTDIDHAKSLKEDGTHHPDNLQILTSSDNREKNIKSCDRFSYKDQVSYIKESVKNKSRLGISIDITLVDIALKMLEIIY